nr:hypothetical protein Itr_chr02CG12470 [Ipomoea trifida]
MVKPKPLSSRRQQPVDGTCNSYGSGEMAQRFTGDGAPVGDLPRFDVVRRELSAARRWSSPAYSKLCLCIDSASCGRPRILAWSLAASQRHAVTDSSSSQVPAGVEVRSANWKTDLDLSANCGDLASASATSPATARRRRSTLTSASLLNA